MTNNDQVMIRKRQERLAALGLSTTHLPGPSPDFGAWRFVETEYGFVVWPHSMGVPGWASELWKVCQEEGITLLEFDRDNDVDGRFPKWEW